MKQKQRRKKKERKRQKQEPKESKQERQEGRKTGQEQERDRERELEKGGGQKRLRRNKGIHSKRNKKCPFLGEKNKFFVYYKAKKGKKTTKINQTIIDKEGLGPREVAHRATSPDP